MKKVASDSAQTDPERSRRNQIIVAALGLPVSPDGKKVLLTQRHAPGNPAWHLKWQLAGGGVEFGEIMEDAVKREMMEELHVEATIIHPYPIVKTSIWYADESDEHMDTQVILIAYLVTIGDQIPDLDHDPDWETAAFGWFTLEEARELDCLPLTLPAVEEAFQLLAHHEIIK